MSPKAAKAEAVALATITEDAGVAIPYDAAGLKDAEGFHTLVRNRQRVDEKIKALQEAKDSITDEIRAIVEASGHKSIGVDDWRVTYSEGRKGSKKIDAQLLLKHGVAASVIAKSTVEGKPGAPYIVVTEAKR